MKPSLPSPPLSPLLSARGRWDIPFRTQQTYTYKCASMRTQIGTRSQMHQTRGHMYPGHPSPSSVGQTHTASRVPPARTRVRAGTRGSPTGTLPCSALPWAHRKGSVCALRVTPAQASLSARARAYAQTCPHYCYIVSRSGLGVQERKGKAELGALPGERNVKV